jgi:hypothetical protein
VRTPVDVSEHPDHPAELDGRETVRFWGARSGARNEDTFARMESGDLVLFYQDGAYVGVGSIGITFEDGGWASETFWDDAPSAHIYTVEDFSEVAVPATAVNHLFDYDGFVPQGLLRVADGRVDRRPRVIERILKRYTEKRDE